MRITLFIIVLVASSLARPDILPPVSDLAKASSYTDKKNYEKAIEHYKLALESLDGSKLYSAIEYETRYSYGLMLNEYTKDNHPEYIEVARKQFEWVIGYLEKSSALLSTRAMALSTLANTYQQEAGYTENEEKHYQLLEKAFSIYKESAAGLEKNRDWHNLAYTYYNLGETAEWYGDLPEAIKWLEKAVDLDKKYGFKDDLKEDSAYLERLKNTHEEMLNKSMQSTADASAD
ncbi:MAG: tetratricopeptide repeat protein [Gammaproteobacteria bacterium]|nr:tetratricopeptide repeat protein [Gammaproteobacteria bacterium]MBQ0775197.1 tetratricopeptide repeat protein [Gammaproteobacteria bacterium]